MRISDWSSDVCSSDLLHLHVDQGLPLVRFGTLVATPLSTLTVLADGPIHTLADLQGRKVGFSIAGTEEATLNAMLGTVGLGLADVELINVNFSLSPSLISGQVDAVVGAYRNFELNQMDIVGRPGRAFYVEEHGVRSEEHTSELLSLMSTSYAVFCL